MVISCLWRRITFTVDPEFREQEGWSKIARTTSEQRTQILFAIEFIWAKPANSPYEELFGAADAVGPSLYRNSIKFNGFLSITNIVFFGSQVVSRDVDALLNGLVVGDPSHLTAELLTYASFVLVSLAQLVLVAPRAFWNFCLVNAVQESTAIKLLQEQSIVVTKPKSSLS